MNYVLPFQTSPELKSLVQKRARQVVETVWLQVELSLTQIRSQEGFLHWSSTNGQSWGLYAGGRCLWLLHIDKDNENSFYYRNRGDLEHFELHQVGHAGNQVYQRVEQIGTLIHSYDCQSTPQRAQIELKLHWWQAQRWIRELKSSVFTTLGLRKAA